MLRRVIAILVAVSLPQLVQSAESVVLGRGVSNTFGHKLDCSPSEFCMDAAYVWVIDAQETVAGPVVKGRIRVLSFQHTAANRGFVASTELFILSPLSDAKERKTTGATFMLVSLSPVYPNGSYCLSVNPTKLGLPILRSDVTVTPDSGSYCFPATLLHRHGV